MQSCHVCQISLLAYEEKSKYGHQDACESSEYSLTIGSRRLYSAQLASTPDIYAHHFEVPSLIPRPVFHK